MAKRKIKKATKAGKNKMTRSQIKKVRGSGLIWQGSGSFESDISDVHIRKKT